MLTVILLALALMLIAGVAPALTASVERNKFVDQGVKTFPMAAATTIYKGGLVGLHPVTRLAKPLEGGDIFAGIAYKDCDNSAGAASALSVSVETQGDFVLPVTSVAVADEGKAVYGIADDTLSLLGHPDSFVGRIQSVHATGYAVVRLRPLFEKPGRSDTGHLEYVYKAGGDVFVTGAVAGQGPAGDFQVRSALGLGAVVDGATGAISGEFDAVAEIASVGIETPVILSSGKGITFECDCHMEQIGDAAAIDVDICIANVVSATSRANLDDASVTKIFGFHMDGASANILVQSDDNVTDVAPVDTTIDNVTTAGTGKKKLVGIIRPSGVCEAWIDGVKVLDGTTGVLTALSIGAAATDFAFLANMEKTSDDTVGELNIMFARAAGARAA